MADLSGRTLGNYILAERIGKGGMADVYRARQESMDRDVAIKVMAESLAANEEFLARFEREARVIARLQHPHILPVIEFGREGDYVYLVMRLIAGGSLAEQLRAMPFTLRKVDKLLGQVASALHYAHQHGIIHRDLKPNNILLDREDNAYLTDFGIAKMLAATTGEHSLTATGNVMGTPAYMAPEQWRSEQIDARTDIYALGVILFEMLMGALPFQAETPFAMMYKHFDTPPPTLRAINPNLPSEIEEILGRALAKRPQQRYPSAQALSDEINAMVRRLPLDAVNHALPRATSHQIQQARPPHSSAIVGHEATTPGGFPVDAGQSRDEKSAREATRAADPPTITVTRRKSGQRRGRRTAIASGILVALLAAIGIAWGILGSGNGNSGDEPNDSTPTTATIRAVSSVIAIIGDADMTQSGQRTPQPTATPDLDATADMLAAQRMTQTAAAWTATRTPTREPSPTTTPSATVTLTRSPTPNIERTVIAAFTRTAAAWTATPTAVRTPTATRRSTATPPTCSMRTRLQIDAGGRVTLDPPLDSNLRAAPGFSHDVLRSVQPGQTFFVTDGPECVDDISWWQVEGYDFEGQWSGWVAEGSDGTYWVEPFATGDLACPGAPMPRLVPGEQGRITLDPPRPSNIRTLPTTSADRLGQLQPGAEFEVVSGPVCDDANEYRWWGVKTDTLQGWVAEGILGEYWMEPLP